MTIRAVATWLFGFIAAAIVTAFISANVRELARQRGWDTFLVHWWDALPDQWRDELRWERLRRLWWLWSIFGLSGGVALALWLTPLLVPPVPAMHEYAEKIATLAELATATQENENLKRELEAMRQAPKPVVSAPVVSPPVADRPKAYTLFDLENRQKALDEFDNCLNTKALNAFKYGSSLYDRWYQGNIDLTKFSAYVTEFRKLLASEIDEMATLSQKYRQKYPEIESIGALIDENLIEKTDMLRNELKRLASVSPNGDVKALLENNHIFDDWWSALQHYRTTIGTNRTRHRCENTRIRKCPCL